MSQADIDRFVADLKDNPQMLEEIKAGATGLASIVEQAQAKGYDITVDEAKSYIREQANQDLSDEQLDAVAGGKSHHHHTTAVATVEAAVTATTEATVAETTTTAAAETEVVIVLT
jgi:predicted ribosomally synthesized peptide with nif11-like leader